MKLIKNIKSLPGFSELEPADQISFDKLKKIISSTYEKYGFLPLDTPTIERKEILFAKTGGDTEKEIYEIKKGDNDLALRFDLTVPLARYVAANYNEINFPFRRYQIAKSFRGERSQRGRFREFFQCDIDIVGDGILDIKNDAEIPSIIYSVLSKLNIGPFIIKISNRKILVGFLNELDLSCKSNDILRIIDKLDKIGKVKTSQLLEDEGLEEDDIKQIFELISIEGSNLEIISKLESTEISDKDYQTGVDELKQVIEMLDLYKLPSDSYKIDLKTIRGLDYYTGTVYETFSLDYPEFGSVCSGGRYDNLVEHYTKRKLPGVGVSIGLTRLFSQMKFAGLINNKIKTISDLLIIPLTDDMSKVVKLANNLRRRNIKTEIYLENKPMKKILNYANKVGVKYVLLIGENEIKDKKFSLKNMENGDQKMFSEKEIISLFKTIKLQ